MLTKSGVFHAECPECPGAGCIPFSEPAAPSDPVLELLKECREAIVIHCGPRFKLLRKLDAEIARQERKP